LGNEVGDDCLTTVESPVSQRQTHFLRLDHFESFKVASQIVGIYQEGRICRSGTSPIAPITSAARDCCIEFCETFDEDESI
jgi:hypothetical protein